MLRNQEYEATIMTVVHVRVLAEQLESGDILTQVFTDIQAGGKVSGRRVVVVMKVEPMTLRTPGGDRQLTRVSGMDTSKRKEILFTVVPDQVLTVTRVS